MLVYIRPWIREVDNKKMNEQKCVLHKLGSEEDNLADLFQPENVLKKNILMQHFLNEVEHR